MRIIPLTLILLLSLGGCTTGSVVIDQPQPLILGSIQGFTGNTAAHAENVRQGMDLAITVINQQGGINGKNLEIIYEDGKCDQKVGVSAVKKLMEHDKVQVIFGPTCSSVALAIAPLAEESKTILFASIPSVPALKHEGDYIFRNRVSGDKYSFKIAEFARSDLNAITASILYINLDNGIAYKDAFIEKFSDLGGSIQSVEPYDKKDSDYRTQLTKIKESDSDVLFIAGQSHEQIVKQVKEMNIKSTIIGPITMQSPELFEIAGDSAEGIYYSYAAFDAQSTSSPISVYNSQYHKLYGKESEAFAANGYDAVMLIADAMKNGCESDGIVDSDCVRDYLYSVTDYPGVGGMTTFDSYGEVSKPLTIKTVKNGEYILYSD